MLLVTLLLVLARGAGEHLGVFMRRLVGRTRPVMAARLLLELQRVLLLLVELALRRDKILLEAERLGVVLGVSLLSLGWLAGFDQTVGN